MLLGFGKNGGSQAYLVDFGLASHYTTKDFKPDPKKMHNGTIEYTSRDAHQVICSLTLLIGSDYPNAPLTIHPGRTNHAW